MLTPAQQKIRRELEELQVKGLLSSGEKMAVPKKENPRFKAIFAMIGMLLCIAVAGIFVIVTKQVEQNKMVHYVSMEQALNVQSDQLLKSFLSGTDTGQTKMEQRKLLQKAAALTAPDNLVSHKGEFLDVMEARLEVISSNKESNELNRLINELMVKQELAKDSLIQALEQGHLKYTKHTDGTIQFWFKSHSYQYDNE